MDSIHRDKNIPKEILFEGIQSAIAIATKKHHPLAEEIQVQIDPETGKIFILVDGELADPTALSRIAAQTAKQVIIQKIREAERDSLYEEFETLKGELITGTVWRSEGGAVLVDLGKTDALLPRSEQIPGDDLHLGERVRAIILDVRKVGQRVKIILSRTHADFVRRLFELEIPEIADSIISIRALAREAGYRSKVAVSSIDQKVDAVGACVGVRGTRIKNIVDELGGERIDIVRWNEWLQTLIPNALQPAEIEEIMLCQILGRGIVIVREDQLSLAIGRRGQNVRLASKLVGWDIEILTSEELDELIEKAVWLFLKIDGIDQDLAERLVEQGILSYDDLSVMEIDDLLNTIEDLSKEQAQQIVAKAEELAEQQEEETPRRKGTRVSTPAPVAAEASEEKKPTLDELFAEGTTAPEAADAAQPDPNAPTSEGCLSPGQLPKSNGQPSKPQGDGQESMAKPTLGGSVSSQGEGQGNGPSDPFQARKITMRFPDPRRGLVRANLIRTLRNLVGEWNPGRVLADGPDLDAGSGGDPMRRADVSYYGPGRLPPGRLPEGELTVVPDVVFEIRSKEDRWQQVLARIVAYLEAGVTLVVILDSDAELVRIYSGDEPERILAVEQDLTLEPVFSGLRVPVGALFV